jgi:hypothetical protein
MLRREFSAGLGGVMAGPATGDSSRGLVVRCHGLCDARAADHRCGRLERRLPAWEI